MTLKMDSFIVNDEGWLSAAHRIPSPNFDAWPEGTRPSLLVVHNISLPPGEFGGKAISEFFCNQLNFDAHPFYAQIRDVRVSAHFLITRKGELLQFVSCQQRAWHAGLSDFFGRAQCNDFALGVELEGSDDVPFEAAQYQSLAKLTKALLAAYPIRALVGHADIAPGRKTDPGPFFDWQRLQADAALDDSYFPYQRSGSAE